MQINIERSYRFSATVIGSTSIITQIILLREVFAVFNGNELLMGLILTSWMLLTGLGAFLGRWVKKISVNQYILLHVLISIIPFISVLGLTLFRATFFPPGIMLDIGMVILFSFFLLAPYCLLAGFMFPVLSGLYSAYYKQNRVSRVYSLEAVGSVLGGLLFQIFLTFYLSSYQILSFILIINFLAAYLFAQATGRNITKLVIVGGLTASLFILSFTSFQEISFEYQYPGQEIEKTLETPYGKLAITKMDEQLNIYQNGMPIPLADNITAREESVHFAMAQHPLPEYVLLISGGLSGALEEILKYPIKQVDYVEINPWLIAIGDEYGLFKPGPRINIINSDPKVFLKSPGKKYDVVLSNASEPLTAEQNRYYSAEFFKMVKRSMKKNGIFMCGLASSGNYLSNEARQTHSIIYNTLKKTFDKVLILPGEKDYFLASDNDLSIQYRDLLAGRNIHNLYFNEYYIDDELLQARSAELASQMIEKTWLNRDFRPVAYYHQLLYWLSHFRFNIWLIIGIPFVLIILSLFMMKPVNLGVFAGGFTASSLQFLILISFQVIFGHLYQMLAIIITAFMAGLALGAWRSWVPKDFLNLRTFHIILGVISGFALIFPFIVFLMNDYAIPAFVSYTVFLVLAFVSGFLTGFQFLIGSLIKKKAPLTIASGLYGADLLGSAAGALLVSVFLLPWFGLLNSCLLIAAYDTVILMVIRFKKDN